MINLHNQLITANVLFAAAAVAAVVVMIYRDHKRATMKRRRWADTADSFHSLRLSQRKPR